MAVPAVRRIVILADPAHLGSNLGLLLAADVGGFAMGPVVAALLIGPFGIPARSSPSPRRPQPAHRCSCVWTSTKGRPTSQDPAGWPSTCFGSARSSPRSSTAPRCSR
ncbi:MAG: hypothetical protein R2705_20840 [Ilumatobacteraceae bacterium]